MKKLGFISLLMLSGCAAAQQSQQPDQATILKHQFQNCVYESVSNQIKRDKKLDLNSATEIGFQFCSTEERSIYTLLYGMGVDPVTANASVLNVRQQIKATIRDVEANPSKYIR